MQEEVINEKAAEKARQAGIFVIMDSCILKEHKARFG
jgi:predicted CoA-binding protein